MINVTKPFLPPIEDYNEFLEGIWKRNWLTNNGPLVNKLELSLREYLDIDNILFLNNGTIALQIAIKALELKGEIITTPFSFIATTSTIVWEGCTPVFADIDPKTLNIDPAKIEAAITDKTTGIIATHVFGNPCDIDAIEIIAKKHNLKVIYDAAHCFGSKYKGRSVFEYGDVVTTSFHATKLYHTIEGGGITAKNHDVMKRIESMRNFGFNGPEDFDCVGINGKNSEFHAAMGLANLKWVDKIMASRKQQSEKYDQILRNLDVQYIAYDPAGFNYSYYPIIFKSEEKLVKALELLNANWIYPRRYFYPSLSTVRYITSAPMEISERISKCVLCLPLYYDLTNEEIDFIGKLLMQAQNEPA